MDYITIITSGMTVIALAYSVYQSKIAREALDATRKSIDQEKINRQISLLPKFGYIIEVQVELESWKKDLDDLNEKLVEALKTNSFEVLEEISNHRVKNPEDLHLSKHQYDEMPEWLSQLWLSGAQYYYSGLCYAGDISKKDKKFKISLTESFIQRTSESSKSISTLLDYISDMVPGVILNTPASVSNSRFFRK